MSLEVDEEILQDFLLEAGEILEQLSAQLVALEHRPEDGELLNAIFRGFHTVKGGAGFLQLTPLVDCCHIAENVFDKLRNHQLKVDARLMDVVLQTLDAIQQMFEAVRAGEQPNPADPQLVDALNTIASGGLRAPAADSGTPGEAATADGRSDSALTEVDRADAEFEEILDALSEQKARAVNAADGLAHGAANADSAAPGSDFDEISADEFEALLDQLHGKGRHGGVVVGQLPESLLASPAEHAATARPATEPVADAATSAGAEAAIEVSTASDTISEDEFEQLLDELQAQGKGAFAEAAHGVEPAADVKKPAASEADLSVEPREAVNDTGNENKPARPAAVGASQGLPEPRHAAVAVATAQPSSAPDGMQGGSAEPAGDVHTARIDTAIRVDTTIRVDTQRLDEIMNMVGELVLVRNRLVRLGHKVADDEVSKAVASLDMVTADLQMSVMKTRMQPIGKVFGRFPRVVRDLARSLNKEVSLQLLGEDTDLDKNLVEALADPLVHLVRNAIDHGIESPQAREAAGKPRVGQVVLSAAQEGDHILLSIEDDGAGLDADKLRDIAVNKGLLDQDAAERLSDADAFNLIFAPGFSTKQEISDVSGRGVGMDVVKTKITQLNGSLNIDSVFGLGCRIEIKVPLTLAIMPTLMVVLGQQAFALPLVSVNEIFHLDLTQTNVVDGQDVVVVREKALPLFHLKRWLVKGAEAAPLPASGHVVIVSIGNRRVGLVVDQLVGQEEVVIKPLGRMLLGTPGMAGATITGDGRIALILDIPNLLKHYAAR